MAFAFSRDGALPGSRWWRRVSTRTGGVAAFFLPQSRPAHGPVSVSASASASVDTFPYAPVALPAVLGTAGLWWRVTGRHSCATPGADPAGGPAGRRRGRYPAAAAGSAAEVAAASAA